MKTIQIIVSPTGTTKVQTQGFIGSECQEASRFVEQALGSRESEQLTGDYYQTTNTRNEQQQTG